MIIVVVFCVCEDDSLLLGLLNFILCVKIINWIVYSYIFFDLLLESFEKKPQIKKGAVQSTRIRPVINPYDMLCVCVCDFLWKKNY